MRIVHIAYSINAEQRDPEVWLRRIGFFIGILENMANFAEVVHINFLGYSGSINKDGVVHYFFKTNYFQFLFPISVHRFIKKLKADVIVVHGLRSPWHVLLLRAYLGRNTKFAIQHHAEKPLRGIKKYLQRFADRYVDAYFFTSLHLAMPWIVQKQITHRNKIHEVMEVSSVFRVIDRTIARRRISVEKCNVYLWVGRLYANKDPLSAVNAFIEFLKYGRDAVLYMIFQTDELLPEIKSILAANSKHASTIKLVGKIDHDELVYWYNSADFIISTSHYEGSGVAVCEAMSCGCIPILSDIPSFRMMTNNGSCGLLFKTGDANNLSEVLQKSLQLDRIEEREKTLKLFQDKLSFHAIALKTYSVLASL